MRELTGTDVKWLAKGYWDNYFNWRIHPKVKTPAIVSTVALVILVVLAIASLPVVDSGTAQAPSTLFPAAMLSLLTFAVAFLWAVFIFLRERDIFLDQAIHHWETGSKVPDRATVVDFVDGMRRRNR